MKKSLKKIMGFVGVLIVPALIFGQTLTTSSNLDAETRTENTTEIRDEDTLETETDAEIITRTNSETNTTSEDEYTRESDATQNGTQTTQISETTETRLDTQTEIRTDAQIDTRNDTQTAAQINTETRTSAELATRERTLATRPEQHERPEEQRQRTTQQARESLVDIASSLQNIDQEARELEGQIRLELKTGVDAAIINIRQQRSDIEALMLQRAADGPRTVAFNALENALRESAPNDPAIVDRVASTVNQSLLDIESNLSAESNVRADLSEARENIAVLLEDFRVSVAQYQRVLSQRDGELLFLDSDGDGLSDYEEIYIYNTDPFNPNTAGLEMTDGELVAAGLDPLTGEEIFFQDPREEDDEVVVSDYYRVDNVQKVDGRVQLSGRGLPNSFLTIYIFSTPVIVTVRTDERGEWTYTLDRQLEDGQHEVFVATVNNAGRIVARSQSTPFVTSAEAATLGSFASVGTTPEDGTGNFFQDNFVLVLIAIVLVGIVITMSLFGKKPKTDLSINDQQDSQQNQSGQ